MLRAQQLLTPGGFDRQPVRVGMFQLSTVFSVGPSAPERVDVPRLPARSKDTACP